MMTQGFKANPGLELANAFSVTRSSLSFYKTRFGPRSSYNEGRPVIVRRRSHAATLES